MSSCYVSFSSYFGLKIDCQSPTEPQHVTFHVCRFVCFRGRENLAVWAASLQKQLLHFQKPTNEMYEFWII